MKLISTVAIAFSLVVVLGSSASGQWLDSFDTYNVGPLAAQSDWEEWYLSTGVDADVTDTRAFSGTNCLLVLGSPAVSNAQDVVYPFRLLPNGKPSSGQWYFSIKTYVPSTATGTAYVIMLNTYDDPGTGQDNWSLQVRFNATGGYVRSDGATHGQVNMIFDQWVTFRAYIDLDNDRVDIYYGAQVLAEGDSWKNGISGGGVAAIAVLDLYGGDGSNGSSGIYFDDASLQHAGQIDVILDGGPNPANVGQVLELTTLSPQLRNQPAALFVSHIDRAPFPRLIAVGQLDANGAWAIGGPVPSIVQNHNFSFGSLVRDSVGDFFVSNREIVLFR
jgi:hypothetical protein